MVTSPAQAPGGAGRIHGGIAAADDDHLFALDLRQRGLVVLQVGLHQVDPGEELVGRQDAEHVLAGHIHEARQTGAGADEDLPEAGPLQGLQGRGLADDEVA